MTHAEEETLPKRKLSIGSLIVGTALAGIAVSAMRIDLINNYELGAKIDPQMAQVFALGAIALTAFPAAAALHGWNKVLRAGTALAVALTVAAAISAYSEKQGAEILARKGLQDAYLAAQANAEAAHRDIAEAKAEVAAITEQLPSAELTKLYEDAKAARDAETSEQRGGVCGKKCRAAEDSMKVYGPRAASAKAKEVALARIDAAQLRLDSAQGATKAGPTEVSALATLVVGQTGQKPEDAARSVALVLTMLSIAFTLASAMAAEKATLLIVSGLGFAAPAPVEVEKNVVTLKPLATRRDETLERLLAMCLRNPEGFIITSDRNLSKTFGVANSTLNKWLKVWADEGKITVEPITAHKKKYAAA